MRKYTSLPIIILGALSVVSLSAAMAAAVGMSNAGAAHPAGWGGHALSVRDDRCYSAINTYSNMTNSIIPGLIEIPHYGLVNAIVNLPIYDWDHSGPGNIMYTNYQVRGDTRGWSSGLRGSLQGKSLGYAKGFNFRTTPVPNAAWVARYVSEQLPYDASIVGSIAGVTSPFPAPSGEHHNPLIANPFMYQQTALIDSAGMPRIPLVTGPMADANRPPEGGLSAEEAASGLIGIGNMDQEQRLAELEANRELYNNRHGAIDVIDGIVSDVDRTVDQFITEIVGHPIMSRVASYPYSVRVDGAGNTHPKDLCYETQHSSNTTLVPSYAFSVPGPAIPVTMPGWIYSIATLLSGNGISSSGVTMYFGGSINEKDMLDCYGRGKQPTLYPSNRHTLTPGGIFQNALRYGTPVLSPGFNTAFLMNTALAAALVASGVGVGVVDRVPTVSIMFEDYTSGFAFLFDARHPDPSRRDVLPPGIQLPDHLRNRAVNMDASASKLADINLHYALGLGGGEHENSQNGQQFNPDIYLRLYSPYNLKAGFELGGDPVRTPDGTSVPVTITAEKSGFTDAPKYRADSTKPGGPTYDPNTGRSFTEARVYKMVMKPGTIVNAIEASKTSEAYYGSEGTNPTISAGDDPCRFFADQLIAGNGVADGSRLTTDGSNANNQLPDEIRPTIEYPSTSSDPDFTCDKVASEDLRMATNAEDRKKVLYDTPEEIRAETPPGTKVCFAVYYTNYTNDSKTQGNHWWDGSQSNYNEDHNTPEDKTYLSRAHCIVSGYKPSLQVRGGDLIVDGEVDTGINEKEFLAEPEKRRLYGSWVEYGVIARGSITNMGSGGLHRTGMPVEWEDVGYLTFSNNVGDDGATKRYGEYTNTADEDLDASGGINTGLSRVARQFASMAPDSSSATVLPANATVQLSDLGSGVYRVSGDTKLVSGAIQRERSIILLADPGSAVRIEDDITIPDDYESVSDISQVVIAPAQTGSAGSFTLNIASEVGRVDAWLINPHGLLSTCHTGEPGDHVQNAPRAMSACHTTLQINGPVAAKHLLLRRTGGIDQTVPPEVHQSVPGESFNLRPDAYIWAAQYVNDGGKKYITTHSMDLPPRY